MSNTSELRRISIHSLPEGSVENTDGRISLIGRIAPPVRDLAPDMVEQYMLHGSLSPAIGEPLNGIANPRLIGSGDEFTAIYVGVTGNPEEVSAVAADRISGLLGHLGIESEIVPEI